MLVLGGLAKIRVEVEIQTIFDHIIVEAPVSWDGIVGGTPAEILCHQHGEGEVFVEKGALEKEGIHFVACEEVEVGDVGDILFRLLFEVLLRCLFDI